MIGKLPVRNTCNVGFTEKANVVNEKFLMEQSVIGQAIAHIRVLHASKKWHVLKLETGIKHIQTKHRKVFMLPSDRNQSCRG